MTRRPNRLFPDIIILVAELSFIAVFAFFCRSGDLFLWSAIGAAALYSLVRFYFRRGNRAAASKNIAELAEIIGNLSSGGEYRHVGGEMFAPMSGALEALDSLSGAISQDRRNLSEIRRIISAIASNSELSRMMDDILPSLMSSTASSCGAFYAANNATGKLGLRSSVGFGRSIYEEFDIEIGEGLVGGAAKSPEITVINNPGGSESLKIKGLTGDFFPAGVMLAPITSGDSLLGILVLAGINPYSEADAELCDLFKYYVAAAVVNCIAFERAERAKNETVFQNSLIQELNKELKLKVEDRNNFMRNIINSIKDHAIMVLDKDGVILEWNRGAELMYGFAEAQAIGRNVSLIYTDEEVKSGRIQANLRAGFAEGGFSDAGWRKKRDGSYFYADAHISGLYNDRGEAIGTACVTKDATKVKALQNELKFQYMLLDVLMENREDAVLAFGENGIIESGNSRAKQLFNMENLAGVDIFSLVELSPEARRAFKENAGARFECSARVMSDGADVRLKLTTVSDKWLGYRKHIALVAETREAAAAPYRSNKI